MALIGRRALLTGLAGMVCAPAIVRATSLMPVRAWREDRLLRGMFEMLETQAPMTALEVIEREQMAAANWAQAASRTLNPIVEREIELIRKYHALWHGRQLTISEYA